MLALIPFIQDDVAIFEAPQGWNACILDGAFETPSYLAHQLATSGYLVSEASEAARLGLEADSLGVLVHQGRRFYAVHLDSDPQVLLAGGES